MKVCKCARKYHFFAVLIICCLTICSVSTLFAECPSADLTGDGKVDFADFAVFVSQWLDKEEETEKEITWVYIDDPGVSGHEGFTGYMSKYETTNAQYCQFLNDALASGDIYVNDSVVCGTTGSNSGADFLDKVYYNLAGFGSTGNGVINGGASRINYTGTLFTVDRSYQDHPVTYVSWYGAAAFCNYYGYGLPDQWQWQAVADYDGTYTYGCGTAIDYNIANYCDSVHTDGTTPVAAFGTYGYGLCDMAGNVSEWTISVMDSNCVVCDGSWKNNDSDCMLLNRRNANQDFTNYSLGFRACRFYQQPEISWVCIDDPGVSGYEGFTGYMSKYETTNAQFCQFLNAALASGDIYVNDRWVYGANGFNSGADFLDQVYYNLAGLGFTSTGVTSGGASRINYTGSAFTVDSGFENHPVTYVSWYGAKAFCNYYGWRLPSKWQWQAVADYDGSYTYGCGNIINQTLANYSDSIHPDGTTAVGSFGAYGYGLCDMAGNVLEWTDSSYFNDNFRISCAGGWDKARCDCTVSYTFYSTRQFSYGSLGFRVCR